MKDKTLPDLIVEILTPEPGNSVVRSANDILDLINADKAFSEKPLTITRLRPRLSEMKKAGTIEKVDGATNNAVRTIAGWRLAGLA